jgi:hypothetical protein
MLILKVAASFPQVHSRSHALRGNENKVVLSFPRSSVGMQSEPLQRLGTQSVHHGIPTETVGTIVQQELT